MIAETVQTKVRNRVRRLVARPIRNLLRNPRATAQWLMRESTYYLGYTPFCRVRSDWQVRCHPCSLANFQAHRDNEECRQELEGLIAHCHHGMIFYDIGAHYGSLALAALRYGGPGTQVVAVDPSPVSNRILKINLRLAGVSERAQVFQAAIGREDGSMPMLATGPAGAHFWIGADSSRTDSCLVPQMTLPTLVKRTGLLPTHIKIDVEGLEDEVLEGGKDLLLSAAPLLFLEIHAALFRARRKRPEAVLEMIRQWGYHRIERFGRPLSANELATCDVLRLVCAARPTRGADR
jgi:FkbM family methyltransferase